MQRLSLSLLAAVLLASIGLGWAIDRVFVHVNPGAIDPVQAYRSVGKSLAKTLDESENLHELVTRWDAESAIKLHLRKTDSVKLPEVLRQQLSNSGSLELESEHRFSMYFSLPHSKNVLVLSVPKENTTSNWWPLALTLTFYAGTAFLTLLWLYPLLKRLKRLSLAAQVFGKGNLASRVQTNRHSNLRDIETSFNEMGQRIQMLVADNKLLTSAVSHDLRTPLARLRFGFDTLRESAHPQTNKKYLDRIDGDLEAMERLIQTLLDYSRLDQELSTLTLAATPLNPIVQRCIDRLDCPPDTALQTTLSTTDCIAAANSRYLEMAINNLLQNAMKYGNGQLLVSTAETPGRVWIVVEDNGPGIPADQRDNLLKPFVRGEHNPQSNDRGAGIGLAIVDRIAQGHHAELSIERSEKLGGARISIGLDPA